MRILVVLAVVFLLALSGCITKKGDGDGGDDGTSGSSTKTGTGSSRTGAPGPNHTPSGSMKANATGAAPTNVTFLLNATDADGDAMTWNLTFGDGKSANGTFKEGAVVNASAMPVACCQVANVTHLYAVAGLYNATLSVSDGKATSNVTLQLNIKAGTPFEQFVAEGTPDLACPQCSTAGANTGAGYRAGINELDSFFTDIPDGAAGQPFTVTSTGGDPDMVFRDSCDEGAAVGDPFQADGPEAGIVPEGATCALMWEPADAMSTITLTIG